jgi:hypothetical protein
MSDRRGKDLRCDAAISIAGYFLFSEASGLVENFQKHSPGKSAGLRVLIRRVIRRKQNSSVRHCVLCGMSKGIGRFNS